MKTKTAAECSTEGSCANFFRNKCRSQ